MASLIDYKRLYLDYVNNFLTVGAFADYYHMSDHRAKVVINYGRALTHDNRGNW